MYFELKPRIKQRCSGASSLHRREEGSRVEGKISHRILGQTILAMSLLSILTSQARSQQIELDVVRAEVMANGGGSPLVSVTLRADCGGSLAHFTNVSSGQLIEFRFQGEVLSKMRLEFPISDGRVDIFGSDNAALLARRLSSKGARLTIAVAEDVR